MNTKRMMSFGRYDLTINKVFYRNMGLMALGTGAGLSLLCFFGRWLVFKSTSADDQVDPISGVLVNTFASPALTPFTTMLLTMATTWLVCIFAGCTFHSLRKKQGRINELTLPATNGEKFCWHVLLSVGGGFLMTVCMLLSADLINLILTLLTYGSGYCVSLTLRVFESMLIVSDSMDIAAGAWNTLGELQVALRCFTMAGLLSQVCIYVYGNSVKYRFNILITYAVLFGITMLLYILGIVIIIAMSDTFSEMSSDQMSSLLLGSIYGVSTLLAIVGGLALWRSYKRYCKAQISARWNR